MENQQTPDQQTLLDADAFLSRRDEPNFSRPGTAYPDALESSYVQMFRVWFELYCDTEWWVSPRKRRAMLRARMAYQDASLLYRRAGRG